MHVPRILLAGTHSGVGKTTIAIGIMAALTRRGFKVQPYKIGPDYIDPAFHTVATGNPSRNLDTWLVPEQSVKELFFRSARRADLAVVEGVMGLYDGFGETDAGSSAHIAKLLSIPVILILDVRSMARSAAAVVTGYKYFDSKVHLAGVILNRVGSESHYEAVRAAVEKETGVPVIGCLYRNDLLSMPERHLGLVPAGEQQELGKKIDAICRLVEKSIDFEKLLAIARQAPPVSLPLPALFASQEEKGELRIAIAKDKAFNFYYQDSLELLENMGAELIPFSPLSDKELPAEVDGLLVGGGFPEMFIDELAANTSLKDELQKVYRLGMPIYAECGGLMYLSRKVIDFEGKSWPMAGLVPGEVAMEKRLVGLGYREGVSLRDSLLTKKGEKIRGHEFHYSRFRPLKDNFPWAYELRGRRRDHYQEGYAEKNILVSYLHVHWAGYPQAAGRFLSHCKSFRERRKSLVNKGWV
ncbi:cobyrinate a,c-diamide synthase [Calderihabitans maritimus]|uniref:Cobyrinate a,c-diamide synthase n=1 Tax=Calderihabitans maritimus TaxID=1246530 RepID=A0A1Z5HQD1_9FIRM|nr:cobyrinate a,c-diamide synthase [Calderihabitans maritimus]GAW91515.1 cobyrinic acid a,c-diamide synthase [Calderihabitans maritimus]